MRGARAALLAGTWSLVFACGRTGLDGANVDSGGGGEGGVVVKPPVDECTLDSDCPSDDLCTPGVCRLPDPEHEARYCMTRTVTCDDANPCTADRCDLDTGSCEHEGGGDDDHDGYRGKALEGMPASCGGNDCDDDDALVFPGASEICDGKDNDCNGAIDEGASYRTLAAPVLIAPGSYQASGGGFAFDGTSYGLTYTDTSASSHKTAWFELLDARGTIVFGPSRVNEINADTYAGSLATSGKAFFTAWADARQAAGYEIYGTRFDPKAEKLEADQRLTDAPGYSLRPSTVFADDGYRIVWVDQRFKSDGGPNAIYGRKITLDGKADGEELRLTTDDEDADSAELSASETRLGVTYVVTGPLLPDGSDHVPIVRFRSFDLELSDDSGPVDLGSSGQGPSIVRTNDTFVVAWHTGTAKPWGPELQAAVVDDRGTLLSAGPITTGDTHITAQSLVSLGDRVLVVWSGTPNDVTPPELYYEVISARDLSVVTPRQLLAKSSSALTDSALQLGPNGDVGVVFDDGTLHQAYFMHVACELPPVRRPDTR